MRKENSYFIDGGVVRISLTQGKEAVVDLADWNVVRQYCWHATNSNPGKKWYARTRVNSKEFLFLHTLLCSRPELQTDHKDNDGLNNCRSNLRLATPIQNRRNTGVPKNNRTGFKGVGAHSGRFRARIEAGEGKVYLGHFDTAPEAAMAYDTAAKRLHGEFANLNFT